MNRFEEILTIIQEHIAEKGYAPTLQYVGDVLGITRERVRQIAVKMKAAGLLEEGLNPPGTPSLEQVKNKNVLEFIRKHSTGRIPPTVSDIKSLPDCPAGIDGAVARLRQEKLLWSGTRFLVETYKPKYTRINYFWDLVDQSQGVNACWNWTLSCHPSGYGHFYIKQDKEGRDHGHCHRHAYELSTGKKSPSRAAGEEETYHLRHLCNNPRCCNPRHLEVGTATQNCEDREKSGNWDIKKRLSEDDIRMVRRRLSDGESLFKIYKDSFEGRYSFTALSNLRKGITYKDVV